ncbi:3-deoxy-manno-octulosonate cytidylyltransferase [Sphingobium subterraneum]|uniref:3-deoxy-manno-octulosonate cytidylyltransferase (CMP-KDO synthetase) n=1 Tax=Sphingobium subterraneum TaxID=627688 RepID=A0A841IZV7_9SPHN|nr:manno-octulosonate cytidylyltransferase [Sphingobium subterraneum]MBB6122806.1 3-deoxy-manno-octulosonate cytidylyltransferase (CMP-KDO synthetase) [Sphingobium subterraneum]
MSVAIVIPARYASTRYPAKPLVMLRGAGGNAKSLIQRSHEAASTVRGADHVYIATDDDRIAQAARDFGAQVIMTPDSCANGTERIAAAAPQLPQDADIIVNFQGDALLTPAPLVEALIAHMQADPQCVCATVAVRCSPSAYRHLVADQAAGRSGGTTAVCDETGNALYFSKRVLPFLPEDRAERDCGKVLMHLGLYAYRRSALATYAALPPSFLEQVEGLEQLRFLGAGIKVHVVQADAPDWDTIELNNPSDVAPIEAILQQRGLE